MAVVVVTGDTRRCCCVSWASLASGKGAGRFSAGADLGDGGELLQSALELVWLSFLAG